MICHIEKGPVAVRYGDSLGQQACRDIPPVLVLLQLREELHHFFRPDRPVSQKPAYKPQGNFGPRHVEAVRGQQIGYDIVIVAGIQGDLVPAGRKRNAADQVDALIAVKAGAFHGSDIGDIRRRAPIVKGQPPSAAGRLQIEANDRHNGRNVPRAADQLLFAQMGKPARAEQYRVIPQALRRFRLLAGLFRFPARARYAYDRCSCFLFIRVDLLRRQRQDRLKEGICGVPNFKLCGMHRDRQTAYPAGEVIPDQPALQVGSKPPLPIQHQWDGRYDRPPVQNGQGLIVSVHQ